jgi:catechol 2,3-dioxygenase-like lactoylglutathione lyase family enzyme
MIGYITLGTNDLTRAAKFYDALLAVIGGKRAMESDRFVSWSAGPNTPGVGVIKPLDGKAATPGNGTMIALAMDSQEKVKALYDKAIQLGGKDEGLCCGGCAGGGGRAHPAPHRTPPAPVTRALEADSAPTT